MSMKKFSRKLINKTLRYLLENKSNDYSSIEQEFNRVTGQLLLQFESFSLPKKQKRIGISVVIPSFNSNKSLAYTLSRLANICADEKDIDLECIVVDDASVEPASKFLSRFQEKFDLKFIRNSENRGAGFSRYRGAKMAKNEILLFLDSDVIPTKNFFINHAFIHSFLSNNYVVIVSFREMAKINDERLKVYPLERNGVNISRDFRFSTIIKPSWTQDIGLHNQEIQLLEGTDNWKKFGHNATYGIWTLPMMGLTCALSCRKSLLSSINFHPELFSGWGFEDVVMCATMIAVGAYMIPNFNSAILHIMHPPRSGSKKKKMRDFLRNKEQYNMLLDSPFSFVTTK